MMIGYILCLFFFVALIFCSGNLFSMIAKQPESVSRKVLNGFILTIAMFQIIATPFMLFQGSLSVLTIIFVLLSLAIFLVNIIFAWKKRDDLKDSFDSFLKSIKSISPVWIAVILLIFIQVYLSSSQQVNHKDDAFYVTISTTALSENRVFPYDPTTGMEAFPINPAYAMVSYEILIAVLCQIFSLHPAVVFHAGVQIVAIPLLYICAHQISKQILNSEKNSVWFLLFYNIFNIFNATESFMPINNFLTRGWQGKNILSSILIPFTILLFLEFLHRQSNEFWPISILLSANVVGGIGISIGGLQFIPMPTICLFLAVCAYKKSLKFFTYMLPPALCGIVYAFFTYNNLFNDPNNNAPSLIQTNNDDISYWKQLLRYNSNGFALILFAVVIILLLLLFITQQQKRPATMIAFYTIFLFITFLNPLLEDFVATYITLPSTYYRLIWLIPVNIIVVYSFTEITDLFKVYSSSPPPTKGKNPKTQKHKLTLSEKIIKNIPNPGEWRIFSIAAIIILIAVSGNNLYNSTLLSKAQNPYQLPQIAIDVADSILTEDTDIQILHAPEDIACYIRQYSSEIKLTWSRTSFVRANFSYIGETDKYRDLRILNKNLYDENDITEEEFKDAISSFGITHVVVPVKSPLNKLDLGYKVTKISNEYILYSILDNG